MYNRWGTHQNQFEGKQFHDKITINMYEQASKGSNHFI